MRIPLLLLSGLSLTYSSTVDVTVHSASNDSFVLGNKAVQLTVAGGRITSLFDVRLKCVSTSFFTTLRGLWES